MVEKVLGQATSLMTDVLTAEDWARIMTVPWTRDEAVFLSHLRRRGNKGITFCSFAYFYRISAKLRLHGLNYQLRIDRRRYKERFPWWQKGINLWRIDLVP